eukprot:4491338-Pyramimonas_sp.AAC.1
MSPRVFFGPHAARAVLKSTWEANNRVEHRCPPEDARRSKQKTKQQEPRDIGTRDLCPRSDGWWGKQILGPRTYDGNGRQGERRRMTTTTLKMTTAVEDGRTTNDM